MTIWLDLIKAYRAYEGVADALKIASTAQWINESGRGTSKLAIDGLNFGGLKFKDRMKGYAEPFLYKGAGDATPIEYCKFGSLSEFVKGYWHFISSGPYKEYKKYNSDPSGYIRYLAKQGYSESQKYVEQVIAGFEEASQLLNLSNASSYSPQKSKVAVIVGHNTRSPGAYAAEPIFMYEYPFNRTVAQEMRNEAPNFNLDILVVIRQPNTSYAEEIRLAYGQAKDWDAHCTVELHFNAEDSGTASGTRVLCRRDYDEAYVLASKCLAQTVACLSLPDRGVSVIDPTDRGGAALYALDGTPGVLIEPFFGTNPSDRKRVALVGQEGLAVAYLRAIRDWVSTHEAIVSATGV